MTFRPLGPDSDLQIMNRLLGKLQQIHDSEARAPKMPVLFVVGLPRSGTTLLTQLLINRFHLGYISNFMAQFWESPLIGAILEQAIFGTRCDSVKTGSEFGRTIDLFGPHEYGIFWRRWFDYGDSHYTVEGKHGSRLAAEVASLEDFYDQPMLFKNLAACGLHASWLAQQLPTAVFLMLRRNPAQVALSILDARIRREGGRENWFSVKPETFPEIKSLNFAEQIARQVRDIEIHLASELGKIDGSRWMLADFETMIAQPEQILSEIGDRFGITAKKEQSRQTVLGEAKAEHAYEADEAQLILDMVDKIVLADPSWQELFSGSAMPGLEG